MPFDPVPETKITDVETLINAPHLFDAWLAARGDSTAGACRIPDGCPIANWLHEVTELPCSVAGHRVRVGSRTYSSIEWITRFVSMVDAVSPHSVSVSGRRARALLSAALQYVARFGS